MTHEHQTPHGTLHTGRNPRAFGHVTPVASLRAARAIPLPPLPPVLSRVVDIPAWLGMMLNNLYGCCTASALGHLVQIASKLATGAMNTPSDAQVEAAYAEVSGFSPGPPPMHDDGAVEQDVLRWLQGRGFPMSDGSRLRAGPVFEVNPQNRDGLCEVIQEFDVAYMGFWVPSGFMEDLPPLWVRKPSYGNIVGGHAVLFHGFDRSDPSNYVYDVTTWGTTQQFRVREDFVKAYFDEGYAITVPTLLTASGRTPYGFDLAGLAAIGGEVGAELTAS